MSCLQPFSPLESSQGNKHAKYCCPLYSSNQEVGAVMISSCCSQRGMGVGEEMPQYLSRQTVRCILHGSLWGPHRNWAPVVTLATNILYWLSSLFSSLADSYTLFIGTIYQRNYLQLQCCLRICFWKPTLRYLNYKVPVFLLSGVFSFEYFLIIFFTRTP